MPKDLNDNSAITREQRKIVRMQNYDYATSNWYYVTIYTLNNMHWLGNVAKNIVELNTYGKIAMQSWLDLPNHYKSCLLDDFMVMSNHVHGIIVIDNLLLPNVQFTCRQKDNLNIEPLKKHSLTEVVRGFKTFSSRKINRVNPGTKFQWQRSFYEHVIRNEKSLYDIRKYIRNNPLQWLLDGKRLENSTL